MKSDTQSNRITGSIVLPVASPLGAYLGRLGAIIPSDGSQPCAALAVAPQDARFVIVDADEVNNLATLEPLDPGHQSRVELSGECAAGDRLSCDQQGRVVATDENLAILMAEEPGVDGQLVLVRPIISRTIGPVGPQGEAGLDGNPGDPGPQGDPGPPLDFQGEYVPETTYGVGVVVIYQGVLYVKIGEGSTLPGDVDWEALDIEVVGPPGPQGEVGPQGPGGHNPCIQGAYDPQQSYVATDMVTCNGILYMALTDSTGADPETNPANWQPLAGATGPQGAPASYAFAGTWSDLTEYNVNDVVSHNGVMYWCISSMNSGAAPDVSPSYWTRFSGPQGAQGPDGPAGPQGAPASYTYIGVWDSMRTYYLNEVVTYGTMLYWCVYDTSSNQQPDVSPNDWTPFTGPAGAQGPAGLSQVAATGIVATTMGANPVYATPSPALDQMKTYIGHAMLQALDTGNAELHVAAVTVDPAMNSVAIFLAGASGGITGGTNVAYWIYELPA